MMKSKIELTSPPLGFKYTEGYLDAWEKNNNPNSLVKICYDGPVFESIDKPSFTTY